MERKKPVARATWAVSLPGMTVGMQATNLSHSLKFRIKGFESPQGYSLFPPYILTISITLYERGFSLLFPILPPFKNAIEYLSILIARPCHHDTSASRTYSIRAIDRAERPKI